MIRNQWELSSYQDQLLKACKSKLLKNLLTKLTMILLLEMKETEEDFKKKLLKLLKKPPPLMILTLKLLLERFLALTNSLLELKQLKTLHITLWSIAHSLWTMLLHCLKFHQIFQALMMFQFVNQFKSKYKNLFQMLMELLQSLFITWRNSLMIKCTLSASP